MGWAGVCSSHLVVFQKLAKTKMISAYPNMRTDYNAGAGPLVGTCTDTTSPG